MVSLRCNITNYVVEYSMWDKQTFAKNNVTKFKMKPESGTFGGCFATYHCVRGQNLRAKS